MVNDPMPWQLTVAQLKEALANAQEGAVVGLLLRAGFAAHPDLDGYYNLRLVGGTDGPVIKLELARESPHPLLSKAKSL